MGAKNVAMPLDRCQQLGRVMASHCCTEAHIIQWINREGYPLNGTTHSRILIAYRKQLARS